MLDKQSDLLITHPKPTLSQLPKYYESDEYISHTDGNQTLIEKVYQIVKGIAIKNKVKLVANWIQKGEFLLDVGCGNGHFLAAAKEKGWNINGVELDPETAARAANLTGLSIAPSLKEIDPEKEFQVITLWHVLEHVYELEEYFQFFKSRLAQDGKVLLALPNPASFDATYFKQYWAAYDVPRHIYHFTPATIAALAQKYGFKLKSSRGLIFDSFYISLLSNEYKTGNKRLLHSFCIGLLSNLRAMLGKPNYSSNLYCFEHA